MPMRDAAQASQVLQQQLLAWCAAHTRVDDTVALFAPHFGEPDVLPVVAQLLAMQRKVALPVVVAKAAPLRFARWAFGEALIDDAYGIAVPAVQDWVAPNVVVMPCVAYAWAHGAAGLAAYRLGYGGGFYDRTVAALRLRNPALQTLGLAYAASRCVFTPAAHDIALGALLTEIKTRTDT